MYDILKEEISKEAAGTRASTVFEISVADHIMDGFNTSAIQEENEEAEE